jgi:hypothetical protein
MIVWFLALKAPGMEIARARGMREGSHVAEINQGNQGRREAFNKKPFAFERPAIFVVFVWIP